MAEIPKESSDVEMTFFEHIDALRPHLLRGALMMFVVMIVAFTGKSFIIDTILFGPQTPDFPTNRFLCHIAQLTGIDGLCINQNPMSLINTSMGGQFNLHMKVALMTGIVIAIPYMLWELWRFISPALTANERGKSRMLVFFISLCFFVGLLFGYYVISPLTVNFLANYEASAYINNMIDVGSYLSTVLNVSLACGVVFQLPLLVYFLARMGLITAEFMRKYRRHAIVVLVIFSAVITPPDIFSLILVAMPLYGLYEYSIILAAGVQRRKREKELAEA